MSRDILDQIRSAITKDIQSVLEEGSNQIVVYQVAQTYLLFQIIDRLENIDGNINSIADDSYSDWMQRNNN